MVIQSFISRVSEKRLHIKKIGQAYLVIRFELTEFHPEVESEHLVGTDSGHLQQPTESQQMRPRQVIQCDIIFK